MAEGNQIHNDGNRNTIVQGAVNSVINIGVNPDTSDVQYDLTSIPIIPLNDVVGRNSELEKLYELLNDPNNQAISVVSGLGGIGKTTLAQAYVTKYAKSYTFKAWITQIPGGDFKQDVALTQDLADNLAVNKEAPTEQVFNDILQSLRRLQTNKNGGLPNLLIIDNADERLLQYKKLLPQPPHWHVLITSREELKPFKAFPLDFLDKAQACSLYKKYHNKFTDEQVKDIVTLVDRHTLTISILAQSAEENRWTYEQVKTALSEDRDTHITHPYSGDQPIDKIKTFLTSIFNFSALNENQQYILNHMAVMPSEFIPLSDIKALLQYEELGWQDAFVYILNRLYRGGWLLKTENIYTKEEQYKLHIIIGNIVIEQIGTEWVKFKDYINHLFDLLRIDDTKDNPVDKFKWIVYGAVCIETIEKKSENIEYILASLARLQNELGRVQKLAGNYEQAKINYTRSLEVHINIFGENYPDLAVIRSNLAGVYKETGDLYKAVELTELALASEIKNFGEDHSKASIFRNNLAVIYQQLGNSSKAAELAELSLETDIRNFGEDHPNVAIRRNNLAVIYQGLGNLSKAAELAELSLEADIRNFREDHPNVAYRRNNLAMIYVDMKKYLEAIPLLEAAFTIFSTLLGENHPNTQTVKLNLEITKRKAAGED